MVALKIGTASFFEDLKNTNKLFTIDGFRYEIIHASSESLLLECCLWVGRAAADKGKRQIVSLAQHTDELARKLWTIHNRHAIIEKYQLINLCATRLD